MALLWLLCDGPPPLIHRQLTPKTNFIVSDFGQWLVVRMRAEVTFEILITVVVACHGTMFGVRGNIALASILFCVPHGFMGSMFDVQSPSDHLLHHQHDREDELHCV